MYWNMVDVLFLASVKRLTLTWDVLKYYIEEPSEEPSEININMRCIEMILRHKDMMT